MDETSLTLPELIERDDIRMETHLLGFARPYTKNEFQVFLCVLFNPSFQPRPEIPHTVHTSGLAGTGWGELRLPRRIEEEVNGSFITTEFGGSIRDREQGIKPTTVEVLRNIISDVSTVKEYGEDFIGWAGRFSSPKVEMSLLRMSEERHWFRRAHVLDEQLHHFLGAAYDEYLATSGNDD